MIPLALICSLDAIEKLSRLLLIFGMLHVLIASGSGTPEDAGFVFLGSQYTLYPVVVLLAMSYVTSARLLYLLRHDNWQRKFPQAISKFKAINSRLGHRKISLTKFTKLVSSVLQFFFVLLASILLGDFRFFLSCLVVFFLFVLLLTQSDRIKNLVLKVDASVSQTIFLALLLSSLFLMYIAHDAHLSAYTIYLFLGVRTASLHLPHAIILSYSCFYPQSS